MTWYDVLNAFYTCPEKRGFTTFLPLILPNADFQNSFTSRLQ